MDNSTQELRCQEQSLLGQCELRDGHVGIHLYGQTKYLRHGTSVSTVDKQPSKESLERARAFFIGYWGSGGDKKFPRGVQVLALEFDAIRRERDETAEKLVEAAETLQECRDLNMLGYFGHCGNCCLGLRKALAAWREREGRV